MSIMLWGIMYTHYLFMHVWGYSHEMGWNRTKILNPHVYYYIFGHCPFLLFQLIFPNTPSFTHMLVFSTEIDCDTFWLKLKVVSCNVSHYSRAFIVITMDYNQSAFHQAFYVMLQH